MTLNENTATGEAFARPHYEAGTIAAWWLGAFMAAVALLAIVLALSREPARGLPQTAVLVPVAVTEARSTPAPDVAAVAKTKPARIVETENAMREASNASARTFDSIVLPPPAIPPGPPQPVRPF